MHSPEGSPDVGYNACNSIARATEFSRLAHHFSTTTRVIMSQSSSFIRRPVAAVTPALFALIGCTLAAVSLAQTPPAPAPAKNAADNASSLSAKVGSTVTELKKIDVTKGTGAEAVSGKTVVVHYTGWLYD